MFIQEYAKDFHARNMAKLQLSLLKMEQHYSLLIATSTTYTFMQLKKRHDMNRNWLQQGAYHNLVKELHSNGEKFQQYFRLTR